MGELIIWLVVGGGVGAAIGQRRGRTGAGAVLGLLLGPIGWLLVLMGPPMGPKCPECKGDVAEGATRCRNCGARI